MMNRKRGAVLILIVCLVVVIGVPCSWRLRREVQHERLNRQLIAAIRRNDSGAALAALEQGADGNARQEQDLPLWRMAWNLVRGHSSASSDAPTALLLVLEYEDAENHTTLPHENMPLLRALLAHGAQVNAGDKDGFTPLLLSLMTVKRATTRLLLQNGANVNASPEQEYSPLAVASAIGTQDDNEDIIETMLQHGANPNETQTNYSTPLWAALTFGRPDRVRLLLRYHAVPNAQMLVYAEKYIKYPGMREIAQILREAGVKK